MKLTCMTDEKHDQFTAVGHVTQLWLLDDEGGFLDCIDECIDTLHYPLPDDIFHCRLCGAMAIVEE